MNIVLGGFMTAGKSTVGRLLAKELSMKFIDTDNLICRRADCSIREIFDAHGEDEFRSLEQDVIASLNGDNQVIAVGGGALMRMCNMEALKSLGVVVSLLVRADTVLRRAGRRGRRPILSALDYDEGRLAQLISQREPLYRRADFVLDVDDHTPQDTVKAILMIMSPERSTPGCRVKVKLGERSYDIEIARRHNNWQAMLQGTGFQGRLAIVTDTVVAPAMLPRVMEQLKEYDPLSIILAPGEERKSLGQASELYDRLLEEGFDRRSGILALGGGVIGDLAGYVASTYMRGISFFQAPTTLLAQVDSSVGGKVAVNHPQAKNIIGSFYQPSLVVIETDSLRSLPERQIRSGLAEVVKYGMIFDAELFGLLERSAVELLMLRPDTLETVIARSCGIKAAVVAEDEREGGKRAILNYGHTFGHALEKVFGYGALTHGEAVSLGMAAAARLSVLMGLMEKEDEKRQNRLLERFGLPVKCPSADREAIIRTMSKDKKSVAAVPSFVLADGVGSVKVLRQVDHGLIGEAVDSIIRPGKDVC